jgi:hypothetical protein
MMVVKMDRNEGHRDAISSHLVINCKDIFSKASYMANLNCSQKRLNFANII